MEHIHEAAHPVKYKFFTPIVIIISVIALNGIVFLLLRFFFGIGFVSNLNDQYPWGIWNAINKAGGIALAAGGFTTAALSYIMNRDIYHIVVRPALLFAAIGYTFAAFAVFFDIGRWYYIWHPMIMWNANSALFEVGICVMIYLTVLYIEFLPILTERFRGKVNLPKPFRFLNQPIESLLKFFDNTFNKAQFIFIIAGVVLSSLHQSSLGTLMIIAGDKIHPLWQTPVLPLLYLISAVAVGFPMVVFEGLLTAKSFKFKPKMYIYSRLASTTPLLLGIYLSFKAGDMFIRKTFVYLFDINIESVLFMLEILLLIIPGILLNFKSVLMDPKKLLISVSMIVAGVLTNRINSFITAYTPYYKEEYYYPSFGEISISIGLIALMVLLFRAAVMIFPIVTYNNAKSLENIDWSTKNAK